MKIKKLNNKGITTIEVIICFVLIVIITVSLFATVSAFNEKRIIEGYKEEVVNYKDTLTKVIQDDFIKIGLTHVKYEKIICTGTNDKCITPNATVYNIECTLKDDTKRVLRITQRLGYSSYHIGGNTDYDDYFLIQYGEPGTGTANNVISYPIPKLGSFQNEYNHTIQDLSINNIKVKITDDNILSVYIGFYHPELTTRYAINIVCPINYISSGSDATSAWNY